jgi:hypothetical protein
VNQGTYGLGIYSRTEIKSRCEAWVTNQRCSQLTEICVQPNNLEIEVLKQLMRIESEREFWMRQLEEWRELVRQRELKKLNTQNNTSINNDTSDKPV